MIEQTNAGLCPDDLVTEAIEAAADDDDQGLRHIDSLLEDYEGDSRLHFLRGSLLAGAQRYSEAHRAMRRAVALAPDFAIARYQLGFLEFTSGEAVAAELTWAPLTNLPDDDPLKLFAAGLHCLARNEFERTIELLSRGVERNDDNPALNRDIGLILEKCREVLAGPESGDEPVSAAHFLLRQHAEKKTRH